MIPWLFFYSEKEAQYQTDLTLRDLFACFALQAAMTTVLLKVNAGIPLANPARQAAEEAYAVADRMLETRKQS